MFVDHDCCLYFCFLNILMCEAKSKACLFLSKDHNVCLYIGLVILKFWQPIAVWTDFFSLFQQNLPILSVYFSIHTDCCAVNVLSYWLVLISSFALIGCSFIAYIYVFVKYPHGLTGQIWNYKCSFNCRQHAFAIYIFAVCVWFYSVNLVLWLNTGFKFFFSNLSRHL